MGNRRHNTRRRHRWHPGTGGRRRPWPQRGRAATVGLQPESAEHHDSARHDDGAGFPAVDRPSAGSSRRRATSPDWIVAESSESTVSLPRPRPGKDAATNHLLSRVGIAAASRHRNVRLILRGARRDGSRREKKSAGCFPSPPSTRDPFETGAANQSRQRERIRDLRRGSQTIPSARGRRGRGSARCRRCGSAR